MRFKIALQTLCALLTSVAALAHTGSLRGIVKDDSSRRPVEGVNVYVKGLKISTVTDAFGAYILKGLPEGHYTVQLSHVGYAVREASIQIEDGVTAEGNFLLPPSGINLSAVTVSADRSLALNTVSSVDIKLRPTTTAQDLLRMVPGLFIAQHQGGGKAEQLFLRGFDVDHGTDVAISVDNMPVNLVSHAHGQGYADLHFLLPELVEKLDFGKGPYAIDKGNLATAGWVALKTKDALDHSFVKGEVGNFGHFRTVAGLNLLNKETSDRQSAYVAGEYTYDRGYFEQPQAFNRFNLSGKYTVNLTPARKLSVFASGFRSRWTASGQIPERAVAEGLISRFGQIQQESGATSRYNLNLMYTQAMGDHALFKSNLFAGYSDFELYSNFTFFLKDTVNGDQIRQKEKRFFAGSNAEYSNDYTLGSLKAKNTVGLGFRYDNPMGSELSHTLNKATILERLAYGDIYETNGYAYVNEAIYLTPRLVLNAGIRLDYFIHTYHNRLPTEAVQATYTTHTFSPKASLYYNFGNQARLSINYGTGFHTNDTRVVVTQAAREILPRAHSFDVGLVVKPYAKLLLSAALWRLDLAQEFVYVGDEGVVEPSGKTRRLGVDFSVRYELLPWLYWDEDFNYTHGRSVDDAEGENYIPLAPVVTSIGGLTAKTRSGFSGSLRYRYMGDRPANEANTVTAKGYTVVDALINYSRPRYELGIQVLNLLNTEWNEAQFDTETRLRGEAAPVSELCFTPGVLFAFKIGATFKF